MKKVTNALYKNDFSDWLNTAQQRRDTIYRNKIITIVLLIIIWASAVSIAILFGN